MVVDNFQSYIVGLRDPATHGFSITPNDTADLEFVTRFVYAGGIGDIALVTLGGDTVTFKSVPAGTILPIRASRVLATGTSASMNLVGLY